MTDTTESKPAAPRRLSLNTFALDTWAVAASVLFIALIVAGIFPRVPW